MKSSIDLRLERLRARHTRAVYLGLPEAIAPRDAPVVSHEARVLSTLIAGEDEERAIRAERTQRRLAADGRRRAKWHRHYVATTGTSPPNCDCPVCKPARWVCVDLSLPPNYFGKERRARGQR